MRINIFRKENRLTVFLKKISSIFLDFILPSSKIAEEISKITEEEFLSKIGQKNSVRELENDFTFSLLDYRDPFVKELIWQIKYKGNEKITHFVAKILHENILLILSEKIIFDNFTNPLLVPIPISKEHEEKRGFSHNIKLTKEIFKIDGGKNLQICTKNLIKNTNTVSQTSLKKSDRLKNIIGSFSVLNPDQIRERNIIILDDVTTTGATLKEAKKIIEKAGAKNIIAITIAH